MIDIKAAKEELQEMLGRKPRRGEISSYLLGLSQGLFVRMGQGAAGEQAASEIPSHYRECPHCQKLTPRDSPICIHCKQKVK